MAIPFYSGRICLNVLAGDLENARALYRAAEGCVEIGVLSSSYPDVEQAIEDMNRYMDVLDSNVSVGLGGGDPGQWRSVAEIARSVKAHHFNQIFPAVGWTRANVGNTTCHINALVSPSGRPGWVTVSTGPLSAKSVEPAVIAVDTAIAMVRDMGGDALKFFPMGGLAHREELIEVALACAGSGFILEPTGGIDLANFEEIVSIIMDAGVRRLIPHVYSSIIDKATGCTDVSAVEHLLSIVKRLTAV